jgi:NitT/TauT family transport system permease protein
MQLDSTASDVTVTESTVENQVGLASEPYRVEMPNPQAKRERRLRFLIVISRVGLLVVVIALWQLAGHYFDPLVVSSPSAVWTSLVDYASSSLLRDLGATMEEVLLGYLLGAALGIVLGGLLASSRLVAGVLDPFIIGVYGVPKIAFGPLLVVWLGINLAPKVALSALMVFFLVFFSTYEGIRKVDQGRINAVRMMGASRLQVRRYVILPGARSSIFLGLKLGIPEALVGAIVGEFISSSKGIGYFVQFSTAQLDTAGVFAGLIVLTILSLVLNAAVKAASREKSQFGG